MGFLMFARRDGTGAVPCSYSHRPKLLVPYSAVFPAIAAKNGGPPWPLHGPNGDWRRPSPAKGTATTPPEAPLCGQWRYRERHLRLYGPLRARPLAGGSSFSQLGWILAQQTPGGEGLDGSFGSFSSAAQWVGEPGHWERGRL